MLLQLSLLMENEIILYGASGHCKVIVDIVECNSIGIKAITDDNPSATAILGYPVIHSSKMQLTENDVVLLSIGNNRVRQKLSGELKGKFISVAHPTAVVSPHSQIGEGTVIMAGAVVNPDTTIGKHCIINSGAVVEHDCTIEDFAHISPNAALAGGVTVGEGTQVGIGASVIQGVKIGKWAVIGAGAVIIKDIPDFAVVVGNPGRTVKINSNGYY